MAKVKVVVIVDGKDVELQIEESELPKNYNSCSPGDLWCKDHVQYKCSNAGKWVKIGDC